MIYAYHNRIPESFSVYENINILNYIHNFDFKISMKCLKGSLVKMMTCMIKNCASSNPYILDTSISFLGSR